MPLSGRTFTCTGEMRRDVLYRWEHPSPLFVYFPQDNNFENLVLRKSEFEQFPYVDLYTIHHDNEKGIVCGYAFAVAQGARIISGSSFLMATSKNMSTDIEERIRKDALTHLRLRIKSCNIFECEGDYTLITIGASDSSVKEFLEL